VTSSYKNSFFCEKEVAISTCRAGNVIGGGDFAADRIIPDCIRAAEKGEDIIVRNPFSTRPYQHVLEPVMVYLMLAQAQYENKSLAGNYNVGPDDSDCWTTGNLVDLFCKEWDAQIGQQMKWVNKHDGGPHEANFLKLDCSKIKKIFGWKPVWNVEATMSKIVEWFHVYLQHGDIVACMENQIEEFLGDQV
jgi:CDP-glucose 4,6-dehydratase